MSHVARNLSVLRPPRDPPSEEIIFRASFATGALALTAGAMLWGMGSLASLCLSLSVSLTTALTMESL